ncbi:MAG: sensor domain-containing diguanylate cyclase [Phycisphaerae bacterium]|nr:sensor domain-containing diguanylate cyclase [Phycisphaerae bacterium]
MIRQTLALLATSTPLKSWFVSRSRNDEHIVLHVSHEADDCLAPGQVYPSSATPCGTVVETGRPLVTRSTGRWATPPGEGLLHECGATIYAGTPIIWTPSDGHSVCFGTLAGIGRHANEHDLAPHLPLINHAASVIGFALQAAHDADVLRRRAERAESESTVDDLTRLYNRRGWQSIAYAEAGRIQRYGSSAGLIMIDLDELKRTNDAYGHRAGDALLRHAAQVIRASFRDSDVIARLGGDEFAVLLMESDGPATRWTAARVQESLSIAGIEASVGWSSLDGSRDVDAALHDADAAMYAAKCARRQLHLDASADRPPCG